MEFKIPVPVCNNIEVSCRLIHETPRLIKYQVTPAIWHPNVTPQSHILCYKDENPKDLLLDESTFFRDPCNIDAALQYKKDRKAFDDVNTQLQMTQKITDFTF